MATFQQNFSLNIRKQPKYKFRITISLALALEIQMYNDLMLKHTAEQS